MKIQNIIQVLVILFLSACGLSVTPTTATSTPPESTALSDLVISSVYLDMQGNLGNCVPAYGPFEIHAMILNQGQAPALNISVQEISTGAEVSIGALESGQSMEAIFPAVSTSGAYSVSVDTWNSIPESNESNNLFSYLAITPTPPMLCTQVAPETPVPTSASGAPILSSDILRKSVYRSSEWGEFQLTDGVFYRTPPNPLDSPETYTTRISEPIYYGDVNMDGSQDALVILNTQNGGNGHAIELALVLNQNGTAYNVSTIPLGNRVAVEAAAVTGGTITLNMRVHGPDDGLCCPSQLVTWSYILSGDQLIKLQ